MEGFKRFFVFDPLNLPSSRRLLLTSLLDLEENENEEEERQQQQQQQAPDLDLTGHSASTENIRDDDDKQATKAEGLRNRRNDRTATKEKECTQQISDAKQPYQVRSKLGQTVYWSPQHHYSTEELEPYRQIGDVEMDSILDLCAAEGMEGAGRFDDIVRISAEAAAAAAAATGTTSTARQALANFHERYSSPPSFVDWSQLQRGIDVFVTYAPAAGTSLYYRSLIGGFSIPKITAVLFATRYLAPPSPPEKVRERLMDTGGFIASCMANDGTNNNLPAASIRPGGQGWAAALRVRHLHARVRRSILQSKSLNWDAKTLGIPINQEDMAATVLAFSVNVLVGIEFVAGTALSEQEQLNYLALWRYLGWLLGVETEISSNIMQNGQLTKHHGLPQFDPCSGKKDGSSADKDPIAHSYAALESIIFHLLNPNDVSQKVAAHLLNIGGNSKKERLQGKVKPTMNNDASPDSSICTKDDVEGQASFEYRYRAFMCRRYLAEPLSDALDLPCPAKYTVSYGILFGLSTFHLVLMRLYTLATMKIPFLRTRLRNWHASGMGKFHSLWEVEHNKRMSNDKGTKKKGKGDNGRQNEADTPACPFAMIMQPQ